MKILTAIAILLFVSPIINAQKCKAKISKMDEMTEQQIEFWGGNIGSKSTIMTGKGYNVSFFLSTDPENDNTPYAVLSIVHQVPDVDAGIFDAIFEENQAYLIKTESGIIEMSVNKINKSNKRFLSKYSVTNQLMGYISKEEAEKLANESIVMFRANSSNGQSVEGKVGSKDAKKLKEQFSCFYQKI